MTGLDDITRARLKRCWDDAKLPAEAQEAGVFQQAIDACTIALLQYETAFDHATAMICAKLNGGLDFAETIFGADRIGAGAAHDEIHAMAAGLVQKLVDDHRDEIESHEGFIPEDGSDAP